MQKRKNEVCQKIQKEIDVLLILYIISFILSIILSLTLE